MYEEAVVTFLINKELYKNDYTLPSKVMISLLDNRYDSLELIIDFLYRKIKLLKFQFIIVIV